MELLENKIRPVKYLPTEKLEKVADEDLTYWIDRDPTSRLVELEHFIGRHPVGNISVLCGFKISTLAYEGLNRVIGDLISFHGHVIIVNNTFRIYTRANKSSSSKRKTARRT